MNKMLEDTNIPESKRVELEKSILKGTFYLKEIQKKELELQKLELKNSISEC